MSVTVMSMMSWGRIEQASVPSGSPNKVVTATTLITLLRVSQSYPVCCGAYKPPPIPKPRKLDGFGAGLPGANADHLIELRNKYLTVAYFTRARCSDNRFDNAVYLITRAGDLELEFR